MDLREHLLGVGAGAITTEDGVKGSLVDDTVEASILILELTNVHLLVNHGGNGLLILLSHLLDNGEGYIDVGDVLEVVLLVHLLRETYQIAVKRVSTSLKIAMKEPRLIVNSNDELHRIEPGILQICVTYESCLLRR